MTRHSAFLPVTILGAVLIVLIVLVPATGAWANGEEFFLPAKNGKVDLVYLGRIKDSRTGRSVMDSVYFLLRDKATGLSFPFTNDKPGHYRSPDIGASIKEIGEAVDVSAFEIDVNVAGYKRTMITRVPRKAQGTVELDLKLDPVVSGDVAAAGFSPGEAPAYTWIILIGSLLLLLIAAGVRTSARRRTPRH